MKSIEINYLTSTGYESLYPNVNCASIVDFAENLYSKSEVDGIVSGLNTEISNLSYIIGEYTGQFNVSVKDDWTDPLENFSDWITITIGFEPKLLILYVKNEEDATAADFITQKVDTRYADLYCLEFLSNGFKTREYAYTQGANEYNGGYAHKNTTYQYIAYKKNS